MAWINRFRKHSFYSSWAYARVIRESQKSLCRKTNLILQTSSRNYSSASKDDTAIQRTRNVGIMAHIDAGKTTTTERMLFYSGTISSPGEVHHGDTVTDYLPQERERGITIQSAVVGFPWQGFHINLIDTPGHVDFTFEVERSLRVMDSAIAILDASAGVEAQTLTVWRQATAYELPRLIFLNKMDKGSASVKMSLESIKERLKASPVLLQEPVYLESRREGAGSGLVGLVDLASLQRIIFDQRTKGAQYHVEDVSQDKAFLNKRCNLIEQLADMDSELANYVIETESLEKVSQDKVEGAIKRMAISANGVPVLLGSSYKNIGVQNLMSAIVKYLPNPKERKSRDPVLSSYASELCAFAFKTIHDKQLGPLTFVRLFSGSLNSGQKIYNVTRSKGEKLGKIFLPLADDFKETSSLDAGQVAVVSGLKETFTGDTLTTSNSVATQVQNRLEKKLGEKTLKPCLSGVSVPEPVFFCSVEPASISQQKGLDIALECLKREDPSLHVRVDPDTCQTVLSGMGELHLEIIHERLKSEFKVDADLGKLMVAYKETISDSSVQRTTFERKLADQKHSVIIELEVHHGTRSGTEPLVRKCTGKEVMEKLATLSEKHLRCITNGVESALRCGPKLGFPVIDVQVYLNHFELGRGTSDVIIEAAAANCVRQCLQNSSVTLLEPIVSLEITVDEKFQHVVVDDLNRRRFIMEGIDVKHGNKVISGTAPLSELMGYSTALRTISSGLGTFSMQFSHYRRIVTSFEEDKVFKEVRGF